jgi:hypothetical protein
MLRFVLSKHARSSFFLDSSGGYRKKFSAVVKWTKFETAAHLHIMMFLCLKSIVLSTENRFALEFICFTKQKLEDSPLITSSVGALLTTILELSR